MTTELAGLRDVRRAAVFKKGTRAGTLVRDADGVRFGYDDAYLAAAGPPVASSLPLSERPVRAPAGAVPPFFSGLLPEGRRLAALRGAVKTSADDELSLLLAVGSDTVGDVRIVPDGEDPARMAPRVRVRDWSEVSFAEVFAADSGGSPDRVGLPGVQPKASAQMISVPVARGTDRFVLKLDPPEFPYLGANELAMLRAARASGLAVVDAELVLDRDGRQALAVRRFDRTADGRLLAVEDGCQVLRRYPADKYTVRTEDACLALARVTDAPIVAGHVLLRWVAFAYVACNGDLHAKNLAVAERADGTVQAAPAYDLPSSYPYGDTTMALRLGGKDREDIGRPDLQGLAAHLGVPERAAGKVLDTVVAAVDGWVDGLGELPFDRHVVRKWQRAVRYRADRLA